MWGNETRKQRGSGRSNENKEQSLARVRAERTARQLEKSQASSVIKIQSWARGCLCKSRLRAEMIELFDRGLPLANQQLRPAQLHALANQFNWAQLPPGGQRTKRQVGLAALMVKSGKLGHGGLLSESASLFHCLSEDPAAELSISPVVRFLSSCVAAVAVGSVPAPVEVIVMKAVLLAVDPATGSGISQDTASTIHAQLYAKHRLQQHMSSVLVRLCPASATSAAAAPDSLVPAAQTALQLITKPSVHATPVETTMNWIRYVLACPCLLRRISVSKLPPLTSPDQTTQLFSVLPAAIERFSHEGGTSEHRWDLWLLGNLMDLTETHSEHLTSSFLNVLGQLWSSVVPSKMCTVVAQPSNRRRMTSLTGSEEVLVIQLRALMPLATAVLLALEPNVPSWKRAHPVTWMLLNLMAERQVLRAPVLTAMVPALPQLWNLVNGSMEIARALRTVLQCGGDPDPVVQGVLSGAFELFLAVFNHWLVLQSDEELYDNQSTHFNLEVLVQLSADLKQAVLAVTMRPSQDQKSALLSYCIATARMLLLQLYDRHSRRPLTADDTTWLAAGIDWSIFQQRVSSGEVGAMRLLNKMPFVIPFEVRLEIFDHWLRTNRAVNKAVRHKIVIRRDHMVQDGVASLGALSGEQLRQQICVTFIDIHGMEEPGIDISGVFKEYCTQLVQEAFSPARGLFVATDARELYPNPNSAVTSGEDHLQLFEFFGRVLAKAVYDGLAVDVPFAYFFLSRLLGRYSSVNELPSLDEELHRSLIFLKTYEGNVEDLGACFTVTEDCFGEHKEVDLVPNGEDCPVTSENLQHYITLVSNKRLNTDIFHQTRAFLKGFQSVVPTSWLQMFNQPQLQRVLSGNSDGDFSVDDLRAHIKLAGGYSESHETIENFWQVLREFTPTQRSLFLVFVTSCPRPPLLGFGHLNPPLTIQLVDDGVSSLEFWHDAERLPTASTCFNLLKLPNYKWARTLRKKLLLVITSGAGFDLS